MRTLKRNAAGDLERDAAGHLIAVSGAEAEAQHARLALEIRLGECAYDASLGIDPKIVGSSVSPVPVNLEIERAVLRATGIARVISCETEVVETRERAQELGALEQWADNPGRLTYTELLLLGEHGGELKIGIGL